MEHIFFVVFQGNVGFRLLERVWFILSPSNALQIKYQIVEQALFISECRYAGLCLRERISPQALKTDTWNPAAHFKTMTVKHNNTEEKCEGRKAEGNITDLNETKEKQPSF